MKKGTEPDFETKRSMENLKSPTSQPRRHETDDLPITSSDIEDSIQLERREAYTERPTQKLLQYLLENEKQDIVPAYNPAAGFTYESIETVFEEKAQHEKTAEFLERLTRLDILKRSFFESVSTCPNCKSTIITMHYRCPKCKSHHITKTSLTEHLNCGFIAERERYLQGRCPKCGNPITENDTRDMGKWYICRECGEKFEDPELDVICRKCGRVFNAEEAKMIEVPKYALNAQRKKEIRQNVASLASISHLLTDLGFKVEMPGIAMGQKSGMQHHFSLIARKQDDEGGKIITIDHAVGESEVQASPLILYIYKISEVQTDLPVFVAIPKLNETAKKIAQGHKILLIEGIPSDESEISNTRKQIEDRLYHLGDVDAESEEASKGSMWKRPMLRRDEKKPSLIDVIPSIHPNQPPPQEDKKKSFMNALKRTIKRDKEQEEDESE